MKLEGKMTKIGSYGLALSSILLFLVSVGMPIYIGLGTTTLSLSFGFYGLYRRFLIASSNQAQLIEENTYLTREQVRKIEENTTITNQLGQELKAKRMIRTTPA